jgi:hypothetical protein
VAEPPDPYNGLRDSTWGTFRACSALGLIGSSLGLSKDWICIPSSLLYIANHFSGLINENQEAKIWSAWQKLRIIFPPKHKQHIIFQNCSFCYTFTDFPKTGISSEHLFCFSCWEGNTVATHFWLNFLLNKDSCRTKLVFLCPILELILVGLEFVDVVLVDVET